MRHLDLFSGIGGFALAAQTVWGAEYENVGFCDNEPFAQAILRKHWPHATIHPDIKSLRTPPAADLVTGGFPCQPFSAAGLRRGTEDDRHLWPEMLRVIRASAPRWVIGENVGGLVTWNGGMVLDQVCSDLEAEGYQVWPFIIPAVAVGAPHRRDRVWIVAHADRGADRRAAGEDGGEEEKARVQERDGVGKPLEPDTLRDGTDAHDQGRLGRGRAGGADGKGLAEGEQVGEDTRRAAPRRHKNDRDAPDAPGARRGKREPEQQGRLGFSAPVGSSAWAEEWPEAAARLCALDDGLSGGLVRLNAGRDAEKDEDDDFIPDPGSIIELKDRLPRPKGWRNAALKGAGNAIVPQVAAQIMQAIKHTQTI